MSGKEWSKYNIPCGKGTEGRMPLAHVLGRSEVNRCLLSTHYSSQDHRGERIFPEERLPGREVRAGSLGSILQSSFNKDFFSPCYVPGTVPGTEDTDLNKETVFTQEQLTYFKGNTLSYFHF